MPHDRQTVGQFLAREIVEQSRSFRSDEIQKRRADTAHFSVADNRAPNLQEVTQRASVHGHHQRRFGCVWEHTASRGAQLSQHFAANCRGLPLGGAIQFAEHLFVGVLRRGSSSLPDPGGSWNLVEAWRLYEPSVTFVVVLLGQLAEAETHPMPHQLMAECARYTSYTDGPYGVLQNALVSVADEVVNIFTRCFPRLSRTEGQVAHASGKLDDLLGWCCTLVFAPDCLVGRNELVEKLLVGWLELRSCQDESSGSHSRVSSSPWGPRQGSTPGPGALEVLATKMHTEGVNVNTLNPIELGQGLITAATEAAQKSYAPYSEFRVGAAVLGDDGRVYTACNVENASYGLSICAERLAIFAAISAGCRRIRGLAIACIDANPSLGDSQRGPCGACRQVMAEFAPDDMPIFLAGGGHYTLRGLFPVPFRL